MAVDPVTEVNERVYENLMRLLEGKNRAEICRQAEIPDQTLSSQLHRRRFTFEVIARIAPALGVTIGELCDPPTRSIRAKDAPAVLNKILKVLERAKRRD